MNQKDAALKLTRELTRGGVIAIDDEQIVRQYMQWAFAIGYDRGRQKSRFTHKPVMKLTMDGREIAVYESVTVAARQHGISHTQISKAVRGKAKTAAGYKWKYVPDKYINEK